MGHMLIGLWRPIHRVIHLCFKYNVFVFFFRLESPTRSVKITAPEGLDMMSSIGKIDIKSLSDLKLESKNKAVSTYSACRVGNRLQFHDR